MLEGCNEGLVVCHCRSSSLGGAWVAAAGWLLFAVSGVLVLGFKRYEFSELKKILTSRFLIGAGETSEAPDILSSR